MANPLGAPHASFTCPTCFRLCKSGVQKEFDFAYYHFVEVQSSEGNINKALDMWVAMVMESGGDVPWANARELYNTIDNIQHGDSPWRLYHVRYQGPLPAGTPPKWMTKSYELCMRDSRQILHHQLATSDFTDKINIDGKWAWSNLMSAEWAWKQADIISENQATHGAMFVPIVAGSDKTMVSVATGHQQYHPVYMSPGNLTNVARRSHGNALLPVAFLPIPKTTKKHRKTAKFQTFCRQLYHLSLARVFEPLKLGMSTPEVVKCPDGHFRCAIYGLGPYIADYPEQVWLAAIVQGWCPKCDARPEDLDREGACRRTRDKTEFLISAWDPGTLWTDFGVRADIVPFTHNFPRADIHELLLPDLLHQVIKGTFKDHLVTWVNAYLIEVHDGRDFQQWTGDDSKALMKVYLAAIAGHLPSEMVKCVSAFLDFCYIARRDTITKAFVGTARVDGDQVSLPRQHSLKHYLRSIQLFGSPNGLCSSITESKHIKAVKEPWRRSSHYKALVQMLRTICRLDKLTAACRAHTKLGMMDGTTASYAAMILRGEQPQPRAAAAIDEDEDDDNGPAPGPMSLSSVKLARTADYIYPDSNVSSADIDIEQCPNVTSHIHVYHSAVAYFFAPSDLCGTGGMHQERIRSNPNWHGEYARYDTVFIVTGSEADPMLGMTIGRVLLFFSFTLGDEPIPCALVHWLIPGNIPDDDTGMWVVQPEFEGNGCRSLSVVHLDSIARGAHLLPIYGSSFLPEDFDFSDSLDAFHAYFVNNCIDHHSHEFLS
ncbi:hypothetical protein BJV74DRAFT_877360 [Russula compacta]|nr:hypothetical protein BJV74DRAFT_877360 [Russula compacta]